MSLGPGKKIIVAPLNWGLGHATRCIPIINALISAQYIPIIASDGAALTLLRKEFPNLEYHELPSYGIRYAKNHNFKWQIIKGMPRILRAVRNEKKQLAWLVHQENIHGVISDNRFGMVHRDIPCVYLTHQLKVLSASTTWLSSKIHQRIIRKFNECWVPDNERRYLSGALSKSRMNLKFLGVLSRLEKQNTAIKYDFLIVLSGPEPQRTLLENRLISVFSTTEKRVMLVRGVFSDESIKAKHPNLHIINYALKEQLQAWMNASEVIIARSGYSTILDLAKLNKKAFFIPTPGQYEQQYLAAHLEKSGIAPYVAQGDFTFAHLKEIEKYTGFIQPIQDLIDPSLFKLFQGK